MFQVTIISSLGFFVGGIPFGLLFAKWLAKKDPRQLGSGNIGATNVLRTGNKTAAALTVICDGLKGFVCVVLAQKYTAIAGWPLVCVALAPVLGHVFSPFLGFKGGKGVATALATYFAFDPLWASLVCCVWLVTFFTFRISALAALVAFLFAPIIGWFFGGGDMTVFSTIAAILIFWTHRTNIQRLVWAQEHRI